MEEKVEVYVINEGGKNPNSVSLQEKVVESIENSTKTVIANVENDEPTTVGDDVHFEIPSAEGDL